MAKNLGRSLFLASLGAFAVALTVPACAQDGADPSDNIGFPVGVGKVLSIKDAKDGTCRIESKIGQGKFNFLVKSDGQVTVKGVFPQKSVLDISIRNAAAYDLSDAGVNSEIELPIDDYDAALSYGTIALSLCAAYRGLRSRQPSEQMIFFAPAGNPYRL